MGRSSNLLTLLSVLTLSFGTAVVAHAATIEWSGTLTVKIGPLPPVVHYGTGVATVNGSSGGVLGPYGTPLGFHLNTIELKGGLSYTGGNNVPEYVVAPVTDPETTVTVRATGVRLGTFSLNGISGGPPLGSKNTGILPGRIKICSNNPGCLASLLIPFGTPSGNVGIGVGGMLTVSGSLKTTPNGGTTPVQVSLVGAPWTVGVASIVATTETANGGILSYTATIQGFVHGPASNTSSTAGLSGVIQVVTPVVVHSSVCTPDRVNYKVGWAEVRLRFIPEPGWLLLLGANLAALVAIGRKRMKP